MTWLARMLRPRLRTRRAQEQGFTVVEVMVASAVIMVVMLSLAYVLTSSLKQVGFAKQRQTANALMDQTMEEVRALPFAAVSAGLDNTDICSSSDANITGSCPSGPFTFRPNGETIQAGSLTTSFAPLTPHRPSTPVSLNNTSYTVGTYVTQVPGNSSVFRATVIVSWTPSIVNGVSNQVSSQTVVGSPANGCLGKNTHPFAAPCQPFFYADATSGKGVITLTPPAGYTGNPIGDPSGSPVSLQKAQLGLDWDDSTMQVEQTSTILSTGQTGQAVLTVAGSSTSTGGVQATSQADNDPATPSPSGQNATPLSQSGTTTLSQSTNPGNPSNGNTLTLVTSDADTGSVIGTSAAAASQGCYDLETPAPVQQATGLPCGYASVQQKGNSAPTMSAQLNFGSSASSLGSTLLASVAAPAAGTQLYTGRLNTTSGGSCTSTSGDGCVHAGAKRSIGTVTLAGLPSGFLGSAPSGWGTTSSTNFLVQVTGYTDSATSESGVGVAVPNDTYSYNISYWNGSGYTTKAVSKSSPLTGFSIPTVTKTAGSVTVQITNTLTAGSATTTQTGTSPCQSADCQATATVAPPLSGDVIYTVTVGGTTVMNLDINVNLGSLEAQSTYQAAPSASS